MYNSRKFPLKVVVQFSIVNVLIFGIWASLVVSGYIYLECEYLSIPFLPVSTVGTALAFYLGFKNNASYDRQWEARKIWGGIVNDSRAFATMLNSFLAVQGNDGATKREIQHIRRNLVNRHFAWLYAHKFYLRNKRHPWEHDKKVNNAYRSRFVDHFSISTELGSDLKRYLPQDEMNAVMKLANPAAQLLNNQMKEITSLREKNIIEDFRLFELQNHINKLYEHQGKNERIKNYPFPRQYSWMMDMFVAIFCLLLPFGLLSEMNKLGDLYIWLTVPFSVLISWVYLFMKLNGDYSENPFQGLAFDIPITSMTRNIEIDMLQMIGEKDVPAPIGDVDGIIM